MVLLWLMSFVCRIFFFDPRKSSHMAWISLFGIVTSIASHSSACVGGPNHPQVANLLNKSCYHVACKVWKRRLLESNKNIFDHRYDLHPLPPAWMSFGVLGFIPMKLDRLRSGFPGLQSSSSFDDLWCSIGQKSNQSGPGDPCVENSCVFHGIPSIEWF